jgi:hypothetical protein
LLVPNKERPVQDGEVAIPLQRKLTADS